MVRICITIFVLCLAMAIGVIWYNVYVPLSPKIGGPASKVLPFFIQLVTFLSDIGHNLGIGDYIKNFRALLFFANSMDLRQRQWEGINIEDSIIANVPVTIFRPDTTKVLKTPVLVHFHGGGLTLGSRKDRVFMQQCILFANGTKSVVISVEYRLAPENVFPAQFNDGLAVVSAIIKEPMKFGIDSNRLALVGDSAGGLLSAAISLELAKQARPVKIAAQVLLYPWLQLIDVTCLPSYRAYRKGFALSDKTMAYFASLTTMGSSDMIPTYLSGNVSRYFMETPYWEYLNITNNSNCTIPTEKLAVELPSDFVEKVTDQRLSPLLAKDLRGSPPTFVTIAEYDVLASEGWLFIQRLKEAGVSVTVKQYKTYHTFISNIGMPIGNDTLAKETINDIIHFLNSVFYNTTRSQ